MTRYQALRRIGCDPVGSACIAFMNWVMGYPANEIRFIGVTAEFDPEEKL